MGETTSKADRAARAHAAIIEIARTAAETGQTAVFWGYCLAVELWTTRGGWIYAKGQSSSTALALAHGRKAFARKIADGRYSHIAAAMAKHYERSMPNDVEPIEYAGAHAFRPGGRDWQGNVRGDLCAFEDCGTSRESAVHVTVAGVPGTSLSEMRQAFRADEPTGKGTPGADEQLVGKYVRVVGTQPARGIVVDVTDHGRSVHVQASDRLIIADPINVSLLDAPEAWDTHRQLDAAGKLRTQDMPEPDVHFMSTDLLDACGTASHALPLWLTATGRDVTCDACKLVMDSATPLWFNLGDIVQIPEGKIGVVESLTADGESLIAAVECGDTRGPFRASTLRHVPLAVITSVEPHWSERETMGSEYVLVVIGHCYAQSALTARALAAYDRKQYPIALTYAVAQQIEQVRLTAQNCVGSWHTSAPSASLMACSECYEPTPTAERVTRSDGVVFAVGDVVRWSLRSRGDETLWRIDYLYVPLRGDRQPYAGMTAIDDPGPGTRHTAGGLALLRHASPQRSGEGTPAVEPVGWRDLDDALGAVKDVARKLSQQGDEQQIDVARVVRRAQYDALRTMLDVLNGWASGARENHEAMGHRGENVGEECWRSFEHEDIVNMVADAADELGTLDPTRAVASDA